MARIYYECLDYPFPAGGIRRLYRHIEILNEAGIESYILHHSPKFKAPWFDSPAPIEYWTDKFRFRSSDILVIPEGHVEIMRRAISLPCRRIVISLNWAHMFMNLTPGETWLKFGILDSIAGGEYERKVISETMRVRCQVISSGIDDKLFCPANYKLPVVTYMPRKNREYSHIIMAAFRASYPQHSNISFEAIDEVSHERVAELLSTSSIFLAHTFPEGLSRKTLEAMACGNIVVGFAGRGSLECMEHGLNCYLAADGDLIGAARLLNTAISDLSKENGEHIRSAAIRTASRYSLEHEAINVVNYWRRQLADS